ncbi:DUF2087 domain-containing protein [Pseudonocardia sp. TRM90224]|uniref:DUF2087 domain-containing protein n=1 Tax=Pseudonocardia sp. TRM90224 TaxID=2812678 RepID=UPI001E5DF2B9|nr:DUF2087 domain-containing protein [Pseudonocardia sp. TRM90224]
MDPVEIVGLLAEPARLRVVAALVLGARTPSDVVAATGLDVREVGKALQKLQAGGLVDDGLAVRDELIKHAARAAAPAGEADRGDVVARFVRDGRLLVMPAEGPKRRQVLDHIAQSFEPGVRYTEREVNDVLRAWTDGSNTDHAALRRYLVDDVRLSREGGEYWRSGGPVDTA